MYHGLAIDLLIPNQYWLLDPFFQECPNTTLWVKQHTWIKGSTWLQTLPRACHRVCKILFPGQRNGTDLGDANCATYFECGERPIRPLNGAAHTADRKEARAIGIDWFTGQLDGKLKALAGLDRLANPRH